MGHVSFCIAAVLCLAACGGDSTDTCMGCPKGQHISDACDNFCGVVPTPVDTDHDGIPDTSDACPNQPETMNGYQDSDGCPDAVPSDSDHDGILDAQDACPFVAEIVNGYQDADGCPDLSGKYSGRWSGQAVLQFQNEAPFFNGNVVLSGAVNGAYVTVTPVCPLGDGTLTTNVLTDQFNATWDGSLTCAPVSITNGCQYIVMTYQSAAFSLSSDGTRLGAAGGGTASGCGITKPFTMTFSGTLQ
jgi:hypothetical protein